MRGAPRAGPGDERATRSQRRRPVPLARGGAGRAGAGLGARAQRRRTRPAGSLAALRQHAGADPRSARLARQDPERDAPRGALVQPVAGRRPSPRRVAPHHARRVPQGAAGVGDPDRPGCTRPRRGRELGLGRRGLFRPGLRTLPRQPVARRRRRQGRSRVRHPGAALRARRLCAARSQVQHRLARPPHRARGDRLRPRLAHRIGLPAAPAPASGASTC
jgi:hypothetical protein